MNEINEKPIISFLLPYYNHFTKTEKRIAQYISNSPDEVVRQTISEIAEKTEASEITVSRFCNKAGFSGLQDLKISLASEIFTPIESVIQDIEQQDSCEEIAMKLFNNIADGLQDTLKIINYEAVQQAVDAIDTAHKIDIYAFGISGVVAHDIENHLLRFAKPVRAFFDVQMQATSAVMLTKEDVVIAVSHTGSNLDLMKSVELAKNSGATVIAITSYLNSPLSKISDIVLNGMGREVNYRSESTASRLVHLAICDLLYTKLIIKNLDQYTQNVTKMRREIAKHRS